MPRSPAKPGPHFPFITGALVVLSLVAFFIWQFGFGVDESVADAGFPPRDWASQAPHRSEHFALSTFMHGGIFHVLANMTVLWVVGSRLERLLGPIKFAVIYILAAYIGLVAHIVLNARSALPMVGAGGAISGIVGAWVMLHRRLGLDSLAPTRLPSALAVVPVWTVAFLWLGIQALSHAISTAHYGGLPAYAELIAGLGAGAASTCVIKPARRVRSGMPATGLEPL